MREIPLCSSSLSSVFCASSFGCFRLVYIASCLIILLCKLVLLYIYLLAGIASGKQR